LEAIRGIFSRLREKLRGYWRGSWRPPPDKVGLHMRKVCGLIKGSLHYGLPWVAVRGLVEN
jgi:hypothetical protein